MGIQGWILTGVFICLLALVIGRVRWLRRRGINAFLFGATHKSDVILPPIILTVVYCLIAPGFGWPIWNPLVARFWQTSIPGWIGVILGITAVAFMAWALVSFGESFRVGIDDQHPAGLVTTGAFAHSRNPIYVCFGFFLTGLFLVQANLITLVALLGFGFVVHQQVLREESFLATHYGADFEDYCTTVRRYL